MQVLNGLSHNALACRTYACTFSLRDGMRIRSKLKLSAVLTGIRPTHFLRGSIRTRSSEQPEDHSYESRCYAPKWRYAPRTPVGRCRCSFARHSPAAS